MRSIIYALGGLSLLLLAWRLPGQTFTTNGWRTLVPSDALPDSVHCQRGNNNLDLIRFGARYYFAFRTAPTHFASSKTQLYVLSTADRQSWRLEMQVHLGADMREPRFAILGDRLHFYFFSAGTNPLGFQPAHVYAGHRRTSGEWTTPRKLEGLDGFVPWRFRNRDDQLYMSAYYGRDLYKTGHHGQMRLYRSSDGYAWTPISEGSQLGDRGGEEGEFIFDAEGNLWGTVRLEGAGGMVVYAHRDSLAHWRSYPTRNKYDSALLFRDGDEIYLVARRSLDGVADKAPWLPAAIRRFYNLGRYSLTQKVTALWHLDQRNQTLVHVMDFPSTGDTAFPAIAEIAPGRWWLMNYSSDIAGPRRNWIGGQIRKTFIYETELVRSE
ncbi:MAG: hypothetical protein AAGN35_25950 [Bacteroidota bacterium]